MAELTSHASSHPRGLSPLKLWSGLVLLIGGVGTCSAIRDLLIAESSGEVVASVSSLIWGLVGLVTAFVVYRHPASSRAALIAWVLSASVTAGLASLYWGDTGVPLAIASAWVGGGLFLLLAWPIDRAAHESV